MKKLAVLSMAALGLGLAGCGTTVTVPNTNPVPTRTAFDLPANSPYASVGNIVNYQSDKVLTSAITGNDGKPYPAGTPVICDNLPTQVAANFDLNNVNTIYARFVNQRTGHYTVVPGGYDPKTKQAVFDFNPGTAPQSIVVTPKPVTVTDIKGYTYLQVVGVDDAGRASNTVSTSTMLPLVDCAL